MAGMDVFLLLEKLGRLDLAASMHVSPKDL